jgi:hypothetical protein
MLIIYKSATYQITGPSSHIEGKRRWMLFCGREQQTAEERGARRP